MVRCTFLFCKLFISVTAGTAFLSRYTLDLKCVCGGGGGRYLCNEEGLFVWTRMEEGITCWQGVVCELR